MSRESREALDLQLSLTERTNKIYDDFLAARENGDQVGFEIMYGLLQTHSAHHRVANDLTTAAQLGNKSW